MVHQSNILQANLAQLRRTEPKLAQRVAQAEPAQLHWERPRSPGCSQSSLWSASVEYEGRLLALASRYDPEDEAHKLISKIDLQKHAGVVILGLGLGYHVVHLAEKIDDQVMVVVFEPDIRLLRAVLERIDHTAWLGRHHIILGDDQMDRSALMSRAEPFAAFLTQGTVLVTHPPTRKLQAEAIRRFGEMVTDVLAYCRTHIATTLVNASRTIGNLSMNLPYYVAGANTNALHCAAEGYPAVCVGAGPSLARNVDQLADPAMRRNVVVITAQTTLKPLLDRGITPDFVTALDYSTISKRFYEDLGNVSQVTMVAEPLAHPDILSSFGGPKCVTSNGFLDRLLGDLAPAITPIPAGATVAHLSFYLAQHLGCDPIILIGQDLGFTDGLYYCPGTAIHQVWVPELGPFNTLEMMQWQRIVRHRGNLKKISDIHDNPIYSDEQMLTYLKQFERDFAQAPQTVLDATEGGLAKEHTTLVTLVQALHDHATRPAPPMPMPAAGFNEKRLGQLAQLLQKRISETAQLRRTSQQTLPLLKQMLKHQADQQKMIKLFDKLTPLRRRVDQLRDIFMIISDLNTIGVFKRARADRAIEHASADPLQEQHLRLERDIDNVDWLIQACDEANDIFRQALQNIAAIRKQQQASLCASAA